MGTGSFPGVKSGRGVTLTPHPYRLCTGLTACTEPQCLYKGDLYLYLLHVSGDYVPIIRRNNCVFSTLGTCYSVWMTVWYAYQAVIHTQKQLFLLMMGT